MQDVSTESGPDSPQALQLSESLLQAGLQLSQELDYAQLSDQRLACAARHSVADFRSIFGDLEAYVHVLQQRLAGEQAAVLTTAIALSGSRRDRLALAARDFLDLSLSRRGAHRWVAELSRRSAPLQATRMRHAHRQARILEAGLGGTWPGASAAEARLLHAALRRCAREEARSGRAEPELRRTTLAFIDSCCA